MSPQNMDNLKVFCNIQWFFLLFHQGFFLVVPLLMLRHEIKLDNVPPGYVYLCRICRQVQALVMFKSNEERTELV